MIMATTMLLGVVIDTQAPKFNGSKISEYIEVMKPIDYVKSNYLAHIIHLGESRRRGYNDYNRGSSKCTKNNRANLNLVRMTVGDVIHYQNLPTCSHNVLFAVGKWQLIPSTLQSAVRYLHINKNVEFDEKLQDFIFVEYLTKIKRPSIHKYILTGEGLKLAARDVAREWASIGSPIHCRIPIIKKVNNNFKIVGIRPWKLNGGCYDGLGTNKSLISANSNIKALQKARHEYVQYRNEGLTRNEAFKKSLGINE